MVRHSLKIPVQFDKNFPSTEGESIGMSRFRQIQIVVGLQQVKSYFDGNLHGHGNAVFLAGLKLPGLHRLDRLLV